MPAISIPPQWEGEAPAGPQSVLRPPGSGVGSRSRFLRPGSEGSALTAPSPNGATDHSPGLPAPFAGYPGYARPRPHQPQRGCGTIGVIALALLFIQCAAPVVSAAPRKKPDPAVPPAARLTVQGERLEAGDIWLPHMDELLQKAKDLPAPDFQDYVARQSADLITDKIAEMLLYQKAKLRLTQPMEKKIDEYVDSELRKRVTAGYDGIQRRMERELEQKGWSLVGYRAHLRRSIIISTYLDDDLRPKVAEPTRAELLAAFEATADSLRKPPRRSMSLIDVRVSEFLPAGESAAPDKDAEARTLARARITLAQSELRGSASFSEVAKKHSHGSKAADGGAWGFVNPESVQDRFAPALAKLQTLQEGQISDVIETPESFFLVKCDQLDPGTNPDFQSVQPQLREQLFARAYNKKISELVMDLRKTAKIEPENLEPFHAAVVAAAMKLVGTIAPAPRS